MSNERLDHSIAFERGIKFADTFHTNKAAEIERLKAELDLRTKERDQAIEFGEFKASPRFLHKGVRLYPAEKTQFPDLYAHLSGRGE